MDNGTTVETFKFLNYMQLAKSSFVSKRFWNLIRTNRHYLALLGVDEISMRRKYPEISQTCITMFDRTFSAEEYNEWVIRNQYSRQIQAVESESSQDDDDDYEFSRSTQNDCKLYQNSSESQFPFYHLVAYADCKADGISNFHSDDWIDVEGLNTTVFNAKVLRNHENWPLFQHFVRLITDPFIYVRHMELTPQNDVLNLLTGAINADFSRLRCKIIELNLNGDSQKFMSWLKDHVLCSEFHIYNGCFSRSGCFSQGELPEALLIAFFLMGSLCTSEIKVKYSSEFMEPSRVIIGFVQRFMDLESSDEYQVVESIECKVAPGSVEKLKQKCGKFIREEEEGDHRTFEFVNNDIGKKLLITHDIFDESFHKPRYFPESYFSLKVTNLR